MSTEDKSKPVEDTQGTGPKPCHPAAIHDKYPPVGTPEHAALHAVPELKAPK